ncbi:MAG: HAD family hydrolase [Clostridia bacterium]|nr:HAD family hydrolase [Clostridia bacterium]
MSIKMILFDLDGTLLPMDQDVFIKTYFGRLAVFLGKMGYDVDKLVDSIWKGTSQMIKNDGSCTNEELFWKVFGEVYGGSKEMDEPNLRRFYEEDFDNVSKSCGFNKMAKEVIGCVKSKGLRVALATNPIFPSIATKKRIAWAGLDLNDFEHITFYENSHFSKPNLKYYEEVLAKLNVLPSECVMIGNDAVEDTAAAKLGIKVFLLNQSIVNKDKLDYSTYKVGDFDDLIKFIDNL